MRNPAFMSAMLATLLFSASFLSNSPAAAADSYGAIAFSPATGATGWSHSLRTRREAERLAMRGCLGHAGDCRVAIWFVNACGALAVGRNGWGSGWGNDRRRAEREAIGTCSANTRSCQVVRWQCSGAR